MQDSGLLARANADLALLQCQEDFQLDNCNVMTEADLITAALQPENDMTATFKILAASDTSIRDENRCSITSCPFMRSFQD